ERVHRALTIRMPHYPAGQVSGLAEGFPKAGGVEPGDGIAAPRPSDAGAGMLGVNARKGGMACVGCHDWGPHRSLGEDGPQLINAAHRLRYEWYQRWMRNPARILSGTSMPNYFSSMDPARAEQTIATLWAALSLGARLPLPEGLGAVAAPDREARPEPVREAMVVRWDMPEATPAAIAVGMPGKISYCFDAGECRLRYAWYGGFVDLSETLYRKTDENRLTPTARILGEMFYKGQGFPFRVGAPDRVPAWRFKGYRIAGGYPEFHYLVDGIDVREHVVPAAAGVGITRRFTIGQVDQEIWFEGRPVPLGTNVRFEVTARKEAG
ncbi:MAG: hypothetical protein HYR60_32165, partial [Acidobacteria bacterium]|nr:hypothetical protein [Acidobacteriota bacterium]